MMPYGKTSFYETNVSLSYPFGAWFYINVDIDRAMVVPCTNCMFSSSACTCAIFPEIIGCQKYAGA